MQGGFTLSMTSRHHLVVYCTSCRRH